jgi:hypothetical protein
VKNKKFKIDLHSHPVEGLFSSGDVINTLKRRKLNGIVFTEHNFHYSDKGLWKRIEKLVSEVKDASFFATQGLELYTPYADFILIGEFSLSLLKDKKGNWLWKIQDVFKNLNSDKVVIIWAHPTRRFYSLKEKERDEILKEVDALEGKNGMNYEKKLLVEHLLPKITNFNSKLPLLGGSDAHSVVDIGVCYTEFEKEISSSDELVLEIKKGKVKSKSYAES